MNFISAFSYITYISTALMMIEQYLTHQDEEILATNLADVLRSAIGGRISHEKVRGIAKAIANII